MRNMNVTFDDEDYAKLEAQKGQLSWREFIMTLIKKEDIKKEGGTHGNERSIFNS